MGKHYAIHSIDGKIINEIWSENWDVIKDAILSHTVIYKGFNNKQEAVEYLDSFDTSKKFTNNNDDESADGADEKDYDIKNLNEDQKRAFDLLISENNVFLSGQAGTGKSYVLNCYLDFIKDMKNIIVCAPSGVAAINVGGSTLHSTFQLPFHPILPTAPVKVPKIIKNADVIIIDEISMCRCDYFDYVGRIIQRASTTTLRPIQLIVVGDFYQLPPVISPNDRKVYDDGKQIDFFEKYYNTKSAFAFESKMWDFFEFKSYILTKVMRQKDEAFIKHLNMIREGDVKGISWLNNNSRKNEVDGIFLCPRNDKAAQINASELKNIPTKAKTFYSDVEGEVKNSDKPNEDEVSLKVGAEVVCLVNDAKRRYQNGSIATIEALDGDSVKVKIKATGKYVTIEPYTWCIENYVLTTDEKGQNTLDKEVVGKYTQIPIKLAYASTVHKSQGQTYDAVNIEPSCFAHGQLYVALSRVKSIDGLHLTYNIPERSLIVDNVVKEFYKKISDKISTPTCNEVKYEEIKVPVSLAIRVKRMVEEYEKMYK